MTHNIRKLTDYEHARHRTEMYLGSRSLHSQEIILYESGEPAVKEVSWVPACYTAFREILDNALDEYALGHGTEIHIEYDENNSVFKISDNGRGIPIDWNEEENCHLVTMVLSHTKSGRNFDERGEVAGTNGLGASIVNFCSEWFHVEVKKDKKIFRQDFFEAKTELQIESPVIQNTRSSDTGTTISWKLSSHVFKDRTLPMEFVRSRVYEVVLANPLLRVFFNGERLKNISVERELFPRQKLIHIPIILDGFKSNFYLKPNFTEESETVHSVVNNIPAFNGGVHIETFKRLFYSGLIDALGTQSKKRKLKPNRSDINSGLLIFNITQMNAPNFDSQSKTRLINEEVGTYIKDALGDPNLFKKIISKNPEWIDEIYQRCAYRTNKKDQADVARETKKLLRSKVPGLIDATEKDRSKCILFLAEGISAISGMTAVRDSKIHGGLGLKGKVMNVRGENPKRVLDSQALLDIMGSIGLQINSKVNRDELRYGKVYIAHDMDEDGKNIGALLVNFFYEYWPELFDPDQEPFLYVFMTPFIIAEKGKQRKYWYARNYHEYKSEDYKGWSITRAKGLGSLTKEDWRHSLDFPELFAIVDDGQINESLDLIFNDSKADDRKKWIGL